MVQHVCDISKWPTAIHCYEKYSTDQCIPFALSHDNKIYMDHESLLTQASKIHDSL